MKLLVQGRIKQGSRFISARQKVAPPSPPGALSLAPGPRSGSPLALLAVSVWSPRLVSTPSSHPLYAFGITMEMLGTPPVPPLRHLPACWKPPLRDLQLNGATTTSIHTPPPHNLPGSSLPCLLQGPHGLPSSALGSLGFAVHTGTSALF